MVTSTRWLFRPKWLDLPCLKLAIRLLAAWLCLVRRFCVRLILCNVYYLLQRNLVFLLIISCVVNVVLTVVSCLCVSVCCSLFSCSYIIMASEYVSSMTVGLLSILEQFCESQQYIHLIGRRFSKQNEISVLAYNQLDFHRECFKRILELYLFI